MNLELYPCSGGMAEGFRRAGITFDMAFDYSKDACASYEKNLGHRPVQMDVHDLVRMARAGWRPGHVDLLVGDPPCTPWSRAGKRQGTDDDRDMLAPTFELIALLEPDAFLIGNVPGLDDEKNWSTITALLAPFTRRGYCVRDFLRLDAADYGVPQHRVRPFWYAHRIGDCLRTPPRTHCDPDELHTIGMFGALHPWVTCRDALSHLVGDELGRPVRLRYRGCNGKQHGSVAERPARTVGTSNLSDGNILTHPPSALRDAREKRSPGRRARASVPDQPAGVVTTRENGDGNQLDLRAAALTRAHDSNKPAMTVTSSPRGGVMGSAAVVFPIVSIDADNERFRRPSRLDEPARVITASDGTSGNKMLDWPWDRPSTTVTTRAAIPPPGHHPETGSVLSVPDAVVLSERAAALLQGFPETWVFCGATKKARWAQSGMAMPSGLAEAVAREVVHAMRDAKRGAA